MPTQAANLAQTGNGAVLSIGGVTGGGTATFTTVGLAVEYALSGQKWGTTNTTTLASKNVRRLTTTLDPGTLSATVLRASADSGQAAVTVAFQTGQAYDFKFSLALAPGQATTPDTYTFSGFITEFGGFTATNEKEVEGKIVIEIDGEVNLAVGA